MSQIFSPHRNVICVNSAWLVSITDKLLPELLTLNFYRMLALLSRVQPSRKLKCGPQLRFKGIMECISSQFRVFCKSQRFLFMWSTLLFQKILWVFSISSPLSLFFFLTLFTACCRQKVQLGSFRKRWCDQAEILCSSLVTTLQGPPQSPKRLSDGGV